MDDRSDEDLLILARDGEDRAFAMLVHRYEAPLFNYLRRMLGNAADAEEIFQETFMRVHINQHRFRATAPFKPWLYRIATNAARDRLRYRRRRPAVALEEIALGETIAAPSAGPADHAAAKETAARLEAAVAKLPLKQRAVFLMARYDEMPYADIARTLRVPVGTVKSRMNKAVKFLLAEMDDER